MSGTIDISALSAPPEKHEFEAAKDFADLGKNIKFIKPSKIPNIHTPDIFMDGVEWEIKSPQGQSKRTIENNLRQALLQSRNVIFDLRRSGVPESDAIGKLEKEFSSNSKLRKLYIITRDGRLIEKSKN